nr:MAG TPA_asm: hypothetical protein [Caudoviricetes sp.]
MEVQRRRCHCSRRMKSVSLMRLRPPWWRPERARR